MKKYFHDFMKLTLLSLFCLLPQQSHTQENNNQSLLVIKKALELTIYSTINPSTYNYLQNSFLYAEKNNFQVILIKLNTPGGLVTTTKDILGLFGQSTIPVIIWITPSGASATSAGALISAGAHFILMSPGTNIGAATPVTLHGSGNPQKTEDGSKTKNQPPKIEEESEENDLRKKSINDLVALVESLSSLRKRNAQGYVKMIAEASSFPAEEAVKMNLINGLASDVNDVWKIIDGAKVSLPGIVKKISTSLPIEIESKEMDLGQKIMDIFANPSLTYILFILGAALLYLELQAPGGFLAGAMGVICLLLAALGFQLIPINFVALGLIILSFIFFILEIFITSFGLLSLAGIISLTFGSLFLYRSENNYLEFKVSLIVSTVMAIIVFLGILFYFLRKDFFKFKNKSRNISKTDDLHHLIGHYGIVSEVYPQHLHPFGDDKSSYLQIKVRGEYWNALCDQSCIEGDQVEVIDENAEKLLLHVKKRQPS